MNSKISSILQTKFQNAPVVKLSELPTPISTNEADTFELSTPKKPKNKKALIIPNIIVFANKPRINKIQKQSIKTIESFIEKFKLDEYVETLKDGTKIIDEYSKDGETLIRRATLDSKGHIYIRDYANKTNIYYSSPEYFSVYKDEKQLIDGTKK